jgi:hypothetical protein
MVGNYKSIYVANLDPCQGDCYVINPDILIYFGFSPEGLGRIFDPVLVT